jgi:predicted pyridoxine 5'-phosphate oxidase superfamily flavin-nucleotide-binding protein
VAILTDAMKRMLAEQRLAYAATVCPDGTPNLSPKATVTVWDDDHLVFADIASPRTVGHLRANPAIEINVVDPWRRKGWRFKGRAEVFDAGPRFVELRAFFAGRGVIDPERRIRSVVLVRVTRAEAVISPVYDLGVSEDEVRASWQRYWQALDAGRTPQPPDGDY